MFKFEMYLYLICLCIWEVFVFEMYLIGQDFIWFPSSPKHCCPCGFFPDKSCPAARWCWAPRMANARNKSKEHDLKIKWNKILWTLHAYSDIWESSKSTNTDIIACSRTQISKIYIYHFEKSFNLTHRWGTTWLHWPIEMSCFAFLSSIRDSSMLHTLHISACLFT